MRWALALVIWGSLVLCAAAAARPAERTGARLVITVRRTPPSASAPTVALRLVNDVGWRPVVIRRVEKALVAQSWQLRRWWGTPVVRFGDSGWMLTLAAGAPPGTCACLGLHSVDLSGRPFAEAWSSGVMMSVSASHEMLEMLVDPLGARVTAGTLAEVCDPVSNEAYVLDGVTVADFVYPSWFTPRAPGPYDQLGLPLSPLTSHYGQFWDGHPPPFPLMEARSGFAREQ